MTYRISEQALLLGKHRSLVGIMTRAVTTAPNEKPAVVILNSGIVHRVGHNRMYVALARSLARLGFNVLRFDFSGIGDSEPRINGLSPLNSSLADQEEVMDWLERERGISRVILIGLCSGADHAILHGHGDPRVVGLILMDPSIPTTVRFYAKYILRRLSLWRCYVSVALGRSGLLQLWRRELLYGLRPSANPRPASLDDLRFHAFLKQSYRTAIDRGAFILAVFTGHPVRQTYREQMLDGFPGIVFGDQLKLEFFQSSDHVFTSETDRAQLFDVVLNWVVWMNTRLDAAGRPQPGQRPQSAAR